MPSTAPDRPMTAARKQVHVAVAVILRRGRVLIARRPEHVHQGGLLEFPGGKVEPGETVQQALVREIAEETGLRVPPASLEPVIGIRHDYGDKQVFLDVWKTSAAQGEPEGREGQPIDWLAPDELQDKDFPAANRPIIRALNLPSTLAITGTCNGAEGWQCRVDSLQRSLSHAGGGLVVLRAPDLNAPDYRKFAHAGVDACVRAGASAIVHGSPALMAGFPEAAGLHLPWRVAEGLSERPVASNVWLGVSCHNGDQLKHAALLGADYAVLGPVLPTASHPGEPALGWERFAALVEQATIPVYGLGGLTPADMPRARALGGQGIAGIGYWWIR